MATEEVRHGEATDGQPLTNRQSDQVSAIEESDERATAVPSTVGSPPPQGDGTLDTNAQGLEPDGTKPITTTPNAEVADAIRTHERQEVGVAGGNVLNDLTLVADTVDEAKVRHEQLSGLAEEASAGNIPLDEWHKARLETVNLLQSALVALRNLMHKIPLVEE